MKSLKDNSQKHDAAYTMESTSTKPISMRPMIRKTKYSPKGHVAEGTQEIDVTTSTTLPTEVNVNVPKVSGKEVVLLWTRADTDLWSDVSKMQKLHFNNQLAICLYRTRRLTKWPIVRVISNSLKK